jgi:glutathione S-transferase
MIKLHQFPRPNPSFAKIANFSPFCMKVETYLKMAGLEYQVVETFDARRAPKGKLPVIEDNGKTIPDSSFIVKYLRSTYGDKLDARLSPKERAIGHAVQRMLEEHFYFVVLHFRWIEDAGWEKTRNAFFESMPAALKLIAPPIVRSGMRKKLDHHGVGRHSPEEIADLGKADMQAISDVLEDKTFLFGDEPTSYDAVVFAFLAGQLFVPIETPVKAFVQSKSNLRAYTDRVDKRWFA